MDELQATHRRQLKDLQSRITQKKKQATKKTRKGVNDECDRMEFDLKEQQAAEVLALGNPNPASTSGDNNSEDVEDVADDLADLAVNADPQILGTPEPGQIQSPAQTQDQDDSGFGGKKPNRARARLARRQAEQEALFAAAEREASDIPNLKKQERDRMLSEFGKRSLKEKEIRADGHCLYSAVADQLQELGLPLASAPEAKSRIPFLSKKEGEADLPPYRQVRHAAASYITHHADDFSAFLEEPLDQYVTKIRDTGEWGGQLELLALAKTYHVNIAVLQGDGRVEEIEGEGAEDRKIWLAYYRHGFGLGEHYNSLYKVA